MIDRAAILGNGQTLEIGKSLGFSQPTQAGGSDVAVAPADGAYAANAASSTAFVSTAQSNVSRLDSAMVEHIERALAASGGRIEGKRGAAEILGINPHTLRARMRKLGIDWSRFRSS